MPEYFVVANSFAAPFFSDTTNEFVMGNSPEDALLNFVKEYKHPCGLFSAVVFDNSDSFHKNKKSMCKWLCNHEIEKQRATKGKAGYTYYGHDAGDFEIDGERIHVENPKGGKIVY